MRGKGVCQGCGKIRALSPIDSGQLICDACLREIKPPRPKHLTSWMKIDYLRRNGFNVSEDILREEGDRLCRLIDEKRWWPAVPAETPRELLDDLMGARYEELESGESGPVMKARAAILAHASQNGLKVDFSGDVKIRHFYTKVVGVTHPNKDGGDRQAIIARCKPFEPVDLEHEDDNPYDPNAIMVLTKDHVQIGYLPREVAPDIWLRIQQDFSFNTFIVNITGGTASQPMRGMNIVIMVACPGASDAEGQAYLDSITPEILAGGRRKRSDEEDFL